MEERKEKLAKIVTILSEYVDLKHAHVLDIGVGSGIITSGLGEKSKKTIGVDRVDERIEKKHFDFIIVNSESLPFDDESFEVVVSNHIIEHTPDAKKHLEEIYRVLKKGGICYLATPNKYFIDPHFRLPFIGFLPRKASNWIVKTIRKREFDIFPLGMGDIRKLGKKFDVENKTFHVFSNPEKYAMKPLPGNVHQFFPEKMAFILDWVGPSFIVILRKN